VTEQFRVRAPELIGPGQWLNTGGKDLSLEGLRGKIVILDFWTFCCINCLHVLDELRELEEKYADVLVIIGVHSPKFVHEAELSAVAAAVERYEVAHPVLNDPDMKAWQEYAVRAWPTLAVIDPEGYVVAQHSGEGHAHALDVLIANLVEVHASKGTLHRGSGPYVAPVATKSLLRFPSKLVSAETGFLVADAGSNRILKLSHSLDAIEFAVGSVVRGFKDGNFEQAQFSEPNGIAALPAEIAAQVGYDYLVADTVNHAIRAISLNSKTVTTVAGNGEQWMQGDGPVAAVTGTSIRLSSPWDVVWWPAINKVVIAMAGIHQLWTFDPVSNQIEVLAGTTNEGLVDGEYLNAWFAQTSGLAVSRDGETLWLADSETSSLRSLRNGLVRTHVGSGLFDFGYLDGAATDARLQHPLGVAVLADESVVIADTYNNAVRRFDPVNKEVSTLLQNAAEPSGLLVEEAGFLVVVHSAEHKIERHRLSSAFMNRGAVFQTKRPAQEIGFGEVSLRVVFTPPVGQKLDDRYGPSTFMVVSASPPELLETGAGSSEELERFILLADPNVSGIQEGVLHVSVRAASCDEASSNEFPACHMHQQDWGVPIKLLKGAGQELHLLLAGL
jgi:thiol-disulfide isomerase/thioredoxin